MDRRITATKRDRKGSIVALCNSEQSWSPRLAKDVLRDISQGKKSYYVQERQQRSYLRAVSGTLQSTKDPTDVNHLSRLPTL